MNGYEVLMTEKINLVLPEGFTKNLVPLDFVIKNSPNPFITFGLPKKVKKYIEDNYEQWFKGTHNSRRYFLGTWLDTRTNTWYIDVSHDAGSKENAINICKQRGEKAYYDMLLGKDVYIEDL